MEIKQEGDRWYAKKSKKAKTTEDITDIIKFDGDFASVMGKAGRTTFHSYLGKHKGRWTEMYGVTSLLNYWGEKEKLLQWAVDRAVDHLVGVYDSTTTDGFDQVARDCFKEARSAHRKSLEDAGAHGTDKHAIVEEYIKATMNDRQLDVNALEIREFSEWCYTSKVTFLASEMPLRSEKLWVAGTTDFICEIDGKRFVGDLKTSNYVSFKNFIQCGAYALMYEEMGYGKIDGIIIVHMPRSGGFKVHTDMGVDNYKEDFRSLVRMVKRDKQKSYELYN